MNMQIPSYAPEAFLVGAACLTLLVDVFRSDKMHRVAYWMAQFSLLATLALVTATRNPEALLSFSGTVVNDGMSGVLKSAILAIVIVVFVYARDYLVLRNKMNAEFFVLGLFAVLGMMVLVSAHSFLTLYLGLELLSLSLYSIVALDRDSANSSEAAMKYFVLGALASGMLLYGISILYGVSGTLDLAEVSAYALSAETGIDNLAITFGLVFVVVGVAFKLGVVPFHMWVPDVYHGASTAATLFIATAPKLAAFALVIRLLVDALEPLSADWRQMLIVLAVLSMATGNLIAIAQDNIKRMLAYSGIAHMGFLLLGVIAGSTDGYAASMFYVIVYAIMSAGAFGMVMILGRSDFESDRLSDFAGLNDRSPWLALIMLILMFSMAGVPPFAGFWAKWFVLKELVAGGLTWLAVLAVVFSIVGAYYYLRVIRLMYFDQGNPGNQSEQLAVTDDSKLTLSLNGIAVLLLGIFPNTLMLVCIAAL